jgi:two-component system, OmpR family, sensor kinase
MKFLTKINRNYLVLFTLLLIGMTMAGYLLLHILIMRGAKENLLNKEYLVEKQIRETGEIPNLHPVIEVIKANDELQVKPSFREVVIRNERENEDELFIEYSERVKITGTTYLIMLRQSVFENEDLVMILALTLFALLSSAFIVSYLITKKMNKTVWADFEHNLLEIENFNLGQNRGINFKSSDIEEFERLNHVICKLTEKLQADYRMLKEFTENASHEIQTPISIALLNLEEIMQLDLSEESLIKAAASISALKRLSGLNHSLILLTKIENQQFTDEKTVSFQDIVTRKMEEFSALLEAKSISVSVDAVRDFSVKMNDQLADILINNLVSNAINHNVMGGSIRIELNADSFRIWNTGENNQFPAATIFDRFVRGNARTYGLGLAIAKKICDTHGLDIQYLRNEYHCFVIKPIS